MSLAATAVLFPLFEPIRIDKYGDGGWSWYFVTHSGSELFK